ncbi:hypothetical protein BC941DRAFT_467925 [Chlamydoabsidia padenii]|nr:hypothetical protein BC941DRAFT_467925 [Chlamydoabsidia padenii]
MPFLCHEYDTVRKQEDDWIDWSEMNLGQIIWLLSYTLIHLTSTYNTCLLMIANSCRIVDYFTSIFDQRCH